MIKLTTIFTINKNINAIVEIIKKIGNYTEYMIVPKSAIKIENNQLFIDEKIFVGNQDFFRKIYSI